MTDRRAYLGVGVVAGVVLLPVVVGQHGSLALGAVLGDLTYGLFAAAAAFAVLAYRQSRDPALLLVGTGAAAAVGHRALAAVLLAIVAPAASQRWFALVAFSSVAGLLALVAALVMVVPWSDRRGRPPLTPAKAVGATVIGLAAFDLTVFATRSAAAGFAGGRVGVLGWLAGAGLLAGGSIVAVRSLPRGGRFGWAAAAGLGTAVMGLTIPLSTMTQTQHGLRILTTWQETAPALAAGSLTLFVIASLRLESTRMRRTTDRATEVMEGRAEIASTIAHDVRGPVGTIKGLATTTRKSYERLGDAERLEFIGMIEQESGRLLRLVDQVALALKIDAGSLDPHLRSQALEPLVRQAVEQTEANGRSIHVDADTSIHAAVDTRWFVEAVRQGLDNACGFSPEDSEVGIRLAGNAEALTLAITDEGPGVPGEMREQLFEKFSRWRPTGYEDRQGSGLGLFICRGIVRAHGGEATLVVPAHGGTMLRIWLPREEIGK